ncbi:MAG: hypothetical protein ACI96W_001539 [Paraglaciecola sp.]|jgi:hypothetical protein
MDINLTAILLICGALLIIGVLGYYACKMLFLLKQQTKKVANNRRERIARIIESVQTISKAVAQQQCNLSEASIRLYHLHESLPVDDKPDYPSSYPGLYELYIRVSNLPTHKAREQLSKQTLRLQDTTREESEAELESQILTEVAKLKVFSL